MLLTKPLPYRKAKTQKAAGAHLVPRAAENAPPENALQTLTYATAADEAADAFQRKPSAAPSTVSSCESEKTLDLGNARYSVV